jgi:glycosidase
LVSGERSIRAGFQEDDAVWPAELQRPECYKRRGQIRDWSDPEEAINGDFLSLKELDITQSAVLATLINAYKYWIATTDLDGFRVDTVKHMESSDTAIFCNAVREYAERIGKQNFFIFGEIVGDDLTIQRYIGRNSRIAGTNERFPSLDAALDFPLYFILEESIKGLTNPSGLRERYERFKTQYADHGRLAGTVTSLTTMTRCQDVPAIYASKSFSWPGCPSCGLTRPARVCPASITAWSKASTVEEQRQPVRECMFGGQ